MHDGDRLSDGSDAGEDEVDAGEELLAVVVLAQLRGHPMHERVLRGVELSPPCGDGREEGRSVRLARNEAGASGVLSCKAENVVHERGRAVELRSFGNAERLELPADAFEDLQHRGLPRLTGELGAHPGVCVNRVEHPRGKGPDRLPRLRTGHLGHDPGDDVVGGRREQIILVGDVPVFDEPDDGTGGRPEVLRGDLRRMLLDSLPDEMVQWGLKVTGVQPLGDGRHELTFADGSTMTTSLLVGADGAWSKIRPLLSDAKPEYVGTVFIETHLYDAGARHPAAAKAVGGGAMLALAPGKGIVAHREPEDILHTYVELNRPAGWVAGIDFTDAAAATTRVAAEFDGWAPRERLVIRSKIL